MWTSGGVQLYYCRDTVHIGITDDDDDEESRKKIDIGIPRNLSLGILGIPSMFTRKELFRKNKLIVSSRARSKEALINQYLLLISGANSYFGRRKRRASLSIAYGFIA